MDAGHCNSSSNFLINPNLYSSGFVKYAAIHSVFKLLIIHNEQSRNIPFLKP